MPLLSPDLTLDAAVSRIALALEGAGLDAPRREARLLVLAVLDLSAARLILEGQRPLGEDCARLEQACIRRVAREPLARIVGHKEFYGLDFALSPATLVPRPDTETLVEAVLDHALARGFGAIPLTLVDLGTGSGAILAALLSALPLACGIGVDLSPDALATAHANVTRHCGAGRAIFHQASWLDGLAGPFEIIVSNPPYIESGDLAALDPEVVVHDPALALDGGPDGLDAYRQIIAQASTRLISGGMLGLELGAGQRDAVVALCRAAGLDLIECRNDLAGIPRALIVGKSRAREGACQV